MPVWICEYPYRTMRSEGPNEECEGCPVWEAMRAHSQAARSESEAGGADQPDIPVLPTGC